MYTAERGDRTAGGSPWGARRAAPRHDLALTLAVVLPVTVVAAVAVRRSDALWFALTALVLLPAAGLVIGGALRGIVVAAAVGFAAVVAVVYPAYIVPTYAYAHLIDAGPPAGAVLTACAAGGLPALWLPIPARRPSTIVLWILYLIGFVPAIVVPVFLTGGLEGVLAYDLALVGSMGIAGLLVRLPPAPIRVPPLSASAYTHTLTALGLLCLAYTAAVFGIHAPPSVTDVYGTRARFASEIPASFGGGYIVPWAANAINPTIMAFGIARRRATLVALGLAGQVLVYSVTGFKTTIFSILLVPLVYFAVAKARKAFALIAVVAVSALLVVTVSSPLTSVESRALATRTYVTPAQITFYYYDFFSTHPPYRLSHSFLRGFVPRPYIDEPPELIGPMYFAPERPHANADMWADAYANFRVAGMVGFTVALGALLLIADGLGWRRDLRVAGPMFAVAGLSLSNSGLFTTVLTSGFGLACLLMALMPESSAGGERAASGSSTPRAAAEGPRAR
jgi:hypothetical protein